MFLVWTEDKFYEFICVFIWSNILEMLRFYSFLSPLRQKSLKVRHRYCFTPAVVTMLTMFSWLGQFLHYHTILVHYIWSTHWKVHVSRECVTWSWLHFHGLQNLLIMSFVWLGQFLHYHAAYTHLIWSTHWTWIVNLSLACITCPWPHFHGLLTLLNLHQVLVIRSISTTWVHHIWSTLWWYNFMVQWFNYYYFFNISLKQFAVAGDIDMSILNVI